MAPRTRMESAIDLASAALGGSVATIEAVHAAIARKPFAALQLAPAVREVSQAVRVVHDGITGLVYTAITSAIAVGGAAAHIAVAAMAMGDGEPRVGSLGDMAMAALNGAIGDRLAREANPLAIEMTLRHG